ncbi:hypothetical protein B7463_g4673, partial [Scytalidium lignicola]
MVPRLRSSTRQDADTAIPLPLRLPRRHITDEEAAPIDTAEAYEHDQRQVAWHKDRIEIINSWAWLVIKILIIGRTAVECIFGPTDGVIQLIQSIIPGKSDS